MMSDRQFVDKRKIAHFDAQAAGAYVALMTDYAFAPTYSGAVLVAMDIVFGECDR